MGAANAGGGPFGIGDGAVSDEYCSFESPGAKGGDFLGAAAEGGSAAEPFAKW